MPENLVEFIISHGNKHWDSVSALGASNYPPDTDKGGGGKYLPPVTDFNVGSSICSTSARSYTTQLSQPSDDDHDYYEANYDADYDADSSDALNIPCVIRDQDFSDGMYMFGTLGVLHSIIS